jgi:hypothetical protein
LLRLRPHGLELSPGLGVLRIDRERVPVREGCASQVSRPLKHHAEVEAKVRVLRLSSDSRFQGPFGLCVQSLLAVGNPQERFGIRIFVVRHDGSRQQIDRLVEVAFLKGLHSLLAKGRAWCFHSS